MTSSAGRPGPAAMTRPPRQYSGWMVAILPSVCAHCAQPIAEGGWQGLAVVPDEGTRWVHEACALELGPAGDPRRPEHDRGVPPDPTSVPAAATLRILVIGSPDWPRERAVEVRDGIAAVARGHAQVGPDPRRPPGPRHRAADRARRVGRAHRRTPRLSGRAPPRRRSGHGRRRRRVPARR